MLTVLRNLFRRPAPQRKFDAAKQTNITRSFHGSWGTADAELRFDLELLRARSRQLSEGNGYFQGFIGAMLNNVLGPSGINFQCKITNQKFAGDSNDLPDTQANDIVEAFHAKVGSRKNYLVTRDMTRRLAERLLMRSWIVDGEVFLRTRLGFDNETRIARQIISSEVCDINYNESILPNGGQIRMGVELDAYEAPVAYHFLKRRPNDYQYPAPSPVLRERVPASEVQHLFLKLRPGQTRGVPLAFAAMLQLRMLGLFEEAALINAKIGASRNLFFTKQYPEGFTDPDASLPTDNGTIPDDLREGEAQELPWGVEPKMVDTRYPSAEMGAFNEAMLRGIAAALNTSYMTLSNDLSKANFSSLRAGLNEERSQWASVQQMWIEEISQPEFETNLAFGLATQQVKLPSGRFEKYNKPVFTGRRWQSVNPLQDEQADDLAIQGRRKSVSECIRASGRDPDEVFMEIANEKKRMAELGILPVMASRPSDGLPEKEETEE